MADPPTSPLIRLKQKLLPPALTKSSETIRVVVAKPKESIFKGKKLLNILSIVCSEEQTTNECLDHLEAWQYC